MSININNYEAYFLDYHEGSLSPALVKELMDFLVQHPQLREELDGFEAVTLEDAEVVTFGKKELLKKEITAISASNFDEYAVQYVEGTLSESLLQELIEFTGRNPQYKKELDLYAKTKLIPDSSIVFEEKYLLKKRTRRTTAFYYWSAAASVAIIIGTYFFLNKDVGPAPSGNNIVKHNKIKDSNTIANNPANAIDSGKLLPPKSLPKIRVIHEAKNNLVAVKSPGKKDRKHIVPEPVNEKNNSGETSDNIANISPLPLHLQNGILFPTDNFFAASFSFLGNIALPADNSVKQNNGNNNPNNYADADVRPERKGNKFLYAIAKFTCKGLHRITGQHIQMEKHYDSDTTTVIAYQLDLGNKKINFPVKE